MSEEKNVEKNVIVIKKAAVIQAVSTIALGLMLVVGLVFPYIQFVDAPVAEKAVERSSLLCATESGNCVESWNGSDVAIYSDGGASQTLLLDGALGDIDSEGDIAVADWWNIGAQTAISVTAGAVITPTGTFQVLESAAAVTTSTTTPIAAGTTEGDLLILRNSNASDAITIDGTGGNVECKANVALAAEDTLWLMWNGSDWICLSGYDNS